MASKSGSGSASSKSGSKGAAGKAAPAAAKPVSNYSIHKPYGGTQNFMHSYGLKMWNPEDVEEMHAITDAIKAADAQNAPSGRSRGKR